MTFVLLRYIHVGYLNSQSLSEVTHCIIKMKNDFRTIHAPSVYRIRVGYLRSLSTTLFVLKPTVCKFIRSLE